MSLGGARSASPARTSRVGFGVSPKQALRSATKLEKSAQARRFGQHARRVRYPDVCALALWLIVCLTGFASAAEVIPPKPDRYFLDEAHVVSPEAARRFNEQLAQFERETSNQLVVAVFPKMQ